MAKNLQPYIPAGVPSVEQQHRNPRTQIYDYAIHKEYERFVNVWFSNTGQDMVGTTVFFIPTKKMNLISDMERVEISYSKMGVLLSNYAKKHGAIPAVGTTGELYYHRIILERFIKALFKGKIKVN